MQLSVQSTSSRRQRETLETAVSNGSEEAKGQRQRRRRQQQHDNDASQYGITPPRSSAKASLTLARLLQPLRDRGPVRTNAYTYTVQRSSLLPVEKRELVADKLHTGHAEEPKRTQSKPRGSCRRSRGRKRGVALRRHLTRNASSTAP